MQIRPQPTPAMIEQAAAWAALLDDPEASDADRAACEAWCAENPLHRLAFDRIAGIGARFDALDRAQRRTILTAVPANDRRPYKIAGGLACVTLLVAGAALASASLTVRAWTPDYRTGIGEQQTIALADGSQLVADTRTSFDAYSGSGDREVALFEGQVMADVARDAARPFVVVTRHGSATALGTRYAVLVAGERTVVTVIESAVRLCPARAECRTLAAGQRVAMTDGGFGPIEQVDTETAQLWTEGWIEVHDRPLPEVLAQLARYAPGGLRFDAAQLGAIRITGAYPLTRPEAALQSIAETTDITLTTASDGMMTVVPGG